MDADLSVIVKAKVEVDEAQAQQALNGFANAKMNPIKIPIEVDAASAKKSIESVTKGLKISPIKIPIEIDNAVSKQAIKAMMADINKQVNEAKSRAKSVSDVRSSLPDDHWKTKASASVDAITNNQLKKIQQVRELLSKNLTNKDGVKTAGVQQAIQELDRLEKKYQDVLKSIGEVKTETGYKQIADDIKSLDSELTKAANSSKIFGDSLSAKQSLAKAEAGIDTLKARFNEFKIGLGEFGKDAGIKDLLDSFEQQLSGADVINIDNLRAGFQRLKAEISEVKAELKSSVEFNTNQLIGEIDTSKLEKAREVLEKLKNSSYQSKNTPGFSGLQTDVEKVIGNYEKLREALKSGDIDQSGIDSIRKQLDQLDSDFGKLSGKAKMFYGDIAGNEQLAKAEAGIIKLKNSFAQWKDQLNTSKLSPAMLQEIEAFEGKLRTVDAVSFSGLKTEFETLRGHIRAAGGETVNFGAQVKGVFSTFAQIAGITSVFMLIRSGAREAVNDVKALNKAMTELKKITDLSGVGYDNYMKDAAKRAKDLGTTYTDYVNGTADFARLGYSVPDAQALSEAANVFLRVGDEINSIGDSSDAIISTMKAFNVEASDAMSIVDKFNQVGNTTSSSSGGLAEALSRSASSLSLAGNSLEQSLGLIVAGNEVVRDYAKVGTGLSTMALRMRGTDIDKEELKSMGEEIDEYVGSVSKLQDKIKALTGVDIMLDEDTFKSSYQILEEISRVWDDLTDASRANVTEILFGKRQANIGASILKNFDSATYAMEQAQNAAGSAMTEHSRWAESIEYSENRASTAFEEFSNKILSSDVVKFYYDAKAGILGFLSDIVDKTGSAVPLITSLGAALLSLKSNFGISKVNMPYPTFVGAVA